MSLWRLYYHLVWGTKERRRLIYADREEKLYHYIISKADRISSIVHAIGGIEDHIHLIVSIPPHLSVANFVKTIKGSSAHYLTGLTQAVIVILSETECSEGSRRFFTSLSLRSE